MWQLPDNSPNSRPLLQRLAAPLTAGGLRQSIFTLVQTSLGGGVLTLAYGMRLTGLGLGLAMLAALALLAFLGMDAMMRGAVSLEVQSTAGLLSKCIGQSSGPVMDACLVLFGVGAMIAYFILLGDFLPSLARSASLQLGMELPLTGALRTRCILLTLVVVIPLSVPKKLSALRYATPASLAAILMTAMTVLVNSPDLYEQNVGQQGFGEVEWFRLDWSFFKAFSIFLFAYNGHLNVVPVAMELQRPSSERIWKANLRVAMLLLVFYSLIGAGGYLSFFQATEQNILVNYETSTLTLLCKFLLSCTLLVSIPTYLNPTVRSAQSLFQACARSREANVGPLLSARMAPHLSPTSSPQSGEGVPANSEALRCICSALCMCITVTTAVFVPNVADVMGFLGASVGTVLMMVLPAIVLLRAPPPEFSTRQTAFTTLYLLGAAGVSCAAIAVMLLQKLGKLPA